MLEFSVAHLASFLSTLSLRRATLVGEFVDRVLAISIHALLAESDQIGAFHRGDSAAFLSTLSLRRATRFLRSGRMMRRYFYPRSPCGERPVR